MEDFPKTDVWNKDDGSSAVVYTYFEGDINSMVDAHFTRALNQSRPATNYYRHKLNSAVPVEGRQLECSSSSKTSAHGSLPSSEGSVPGRPASFDLPTDPLSLAGELRPRGGEGWPSLMDSLPRPAEGLDLLESHFMNPLLRVLCSDGPDLGTVVTTGSRAGVIHRWAPNHLFTQQPNPNDRLNSRILYFPTE